MNFRITLFQPPTPVPTKYQNTFSHLYGDVAWFGLMAGSSLAFLAVYVARLGASAEQLGLLSAVPAVVNLLFALPAGRWLEKHSKSRPVFWSSLVFRLFYLAMVPLPWIFSNSAQIWIILLITFIMNIPGTALSIGFNALFGEAVPPEWRGHVAGMRNAVLSVTTIFASIGCGEILVRLPFPAGYQVVFFLGFLGAIFSTYNLWFVCPTSETPGMAVDTHVSANRLTAEEHPDPAPLRKNGSRWLDWTHSFSLLRLDILKGRYKRILMLLVAFHFAQFLSIPLFSIYMVDALHFTDQVIGFGTAMFNVTVFLGSTQLARMTVSMGNHKTTGIGIAMLSLYPFLLAFSHNVPLFIITSLIGGAAWALAGGALYNYLLEYVPENDRPAYLAWYNLGLNAAILIGSLGGTFIAGQIGLATALIIFGIARLLSGLAILRWG